MKVSFTEAPDETPRPKQLPDFLASLVGGILQITCRRFVVFSSSCTVRTVMVAHSPHTQKIPPDGFFLYSSQAVHLAPTHAPACWRQLNTSLNQINTLTLNINTSETNSTPYLPPLHVFSLQPSQQRADVVPRLPLVQQLLEHLHPRTGSLHHRADAGDFQLLVGRF